jgi:hypothetical protein
MLAQLQPTGSGKDGDVSAARAAIAAAEEPAAAGRQGPVVDVEVVRTTRPRRLPLATIAMAAGIDAVALLVLVVGHGRPAAYLVAALLHLGAMVPLLAVPGLRGSRRWLVLALGLTLPLVGAPVAALALDTVGQSALDVPMPDDDVEEPLLDAANVRQVAQAPTACEALLGAEAEQRRAMLSALSRRGDRSAVALLRWALTCDDAELAVEAALALEEMSTLFEDRLAAVRAELGARPSYEAALDAGRTIAAAMEAGIVDGPLLGQLAGEGRRSFALAVELRPQAEPEVAPAWARLELAAMRPDAALRVVDQALQQAGTDGEACARLYPLREEALLASHDVPWEGPSAMATYRRELPRSLAWSLPSPPPSARAVRWRLPPPPKETRRGRTT